MSGFQSAFCRLHDEIFLLRAECDSLRVRLKSSDRALQETRKKLALETKAHGRCKSRLLDLESALASKLAVESETALQLSSLRSANQLLTASLADAESKVSFVDSSKSQLSEYEARIKSLDSKMKGMSLLTEKCMEKMRTASNALANGIRVTTTLIRQHSQEVSELFAFNNRDIHEAVSRTFKQLIIPVDMEFHQQLFGEQAAEEDEHLVGLSSFLVGDYGVMDTFCHKDSPLWLSLRRGIMDFWKVNSWDLMQQSTHNLLQMMSIYFEAMIANTASPAKPVPASPTPLLTPAYSSAPAGLRECFSLPRIPAMMSSGPDTAMKILNRLEMVSCRLGSPWHSNCKMFMERDQCSSFLHDSSFRFFLSCHGVFMFDIGSGFVFRFATIPDAYRRSFSSQGYTIEDIWKAQSSICKGGIRVRKPGSSASPISTNVPCTHTADAIDILNNMIDTSAMAESTTASSSAIQAAFLLRITNQFVLTMPHIAITKLMVGYRSEMMEKHKLAVLDAALKNMQHASETLGYIRKPSEEGDLNIALNFNIPAVNLPARAIHIPPVVKFMLVHKFRNTGVKSNVASELGRSMNLSRGIRMRAYVNYHDEPNLGAMDEMEPWLIAMERNQQRGHTEGHSEADISRHGPNFKFAYARTICLGMYIHSFVICPTGLQHQISLMPMANEIGNIVQQSMCKLLGVVPPPHLNEVTHLLWESAYTSQMKIYFDDVREAVQRAIKSDSLVRRAFHPHKSDSHPKFS